MNTYQAFEKFLTCAAVVGLGELGDGAFKLLVEGVRAADEADGAHAVSVLCRGLAGGLDYLGMVGEPEVVVRAHVEELGAVLQNNVRALRRGNDLLILVQALGLEVSNRLLKV